VIFRSLIGGGGVGGLGSEDIGKGTAGKPTWTNDGGSLLRDHRSAEGGGIVSSWVRCLPGEQRCFTYHKGM